MDLQKGVINLNKFQEYLYLNELVKIKQRVDEAYQIIGMLKKELDQIEIPLEKLIYHSGNSEPES